MSSPRSPTQASSARDDLLFDAHDSRSRRGRLAFSLLGTVLTTWAVVVLFSHQEAATPVQPQTPGSPGRAKLVAATGRMEPVREVKISPEVSGEIIELPVQEGQQVRKGDLLLTIKPDFYIASRDQAEGSYKSALANMDMAKARLQEVQAELKRSQELHRSKLLSDAAFEEVTAAHDIARAQLSSTEGQIEMARASLARAQYDLDKTTIHSPINGTVTRLTTAVGERVVGTATMAGTEVMTLADLNEMEARVQVGEKDIGLIGRGQKARLELEAFPDRPFDGTVLEIATSSNGSSSPEGLGARPTARFAVRIRPQDRRAFRPGMSVTAKIRVSPTIPATAAPTVSSGAPGRRSNG
jgi:HlyD family secretion protein